MTFLVATKTRAPPRPCAMRIRMPSRGTRKWPVALTAKDRSQSASESRSTGQECAMPAFDTRMSSPPYASTVSSRPALTESSLLTSIRRPSALPGPREVAISSAAFRAPASSRSVRGRRRRRSDRKSTRLNSSHGYISYAVFCLKKKKKTLSNLTDLLYDRDRYTHQPSLRFAHFADHLGVPLCQPSDATGLIFLFAGLQLCTSAD